MKEEQLYLNQTINAIQNRLNKYELQLLDNAKQKEITKDQMTSNVYDMDDEELSRQKTILDEIEREEDVIEKAKQKLEKQINKPYFARIDFSEENEPVEKIYIGLGFVKDENKALVFDWRAPISSMYYEYDTGKASYDCDYGKINGEILLKRQFNIENQKLKFYIDTKETINDGILQEVLSKNTSSKMREIVSTIQKEQNSLIRINENKNILVQGVAGSGKTSIALHRAAYLLYKNKNTFKNSDIFILSPTNLFSDYISDVLPQLGEESTNGATFLTIAKAELDKKIESRDVFVDGLCEKKSSKTLKDIAYKSSFVFLDDLNYFLNKIFAPSFKPKDLTFKARNSENNQFTFSKEEISDLYFKSYKNLSIAKKINYIAETLIERFNLRNDEWAPIKERFKKFLYDFFPSLDILEILNLFYLSKGVGLIRDNSYHYDDIAALLIIKDFMYGLNIDIPCKYLIIDEMQDFTPCHFYLFNKIWPCPKLILGDINQCIEKKLSSDYLKNLSQFLDAETTSLNKTYRSTKQISTLSQKIIGLKDVVNMNRDGQEPEFISSKLLIQEILKLINQNQNFKHIAIIAKTSKEANEIYEELNKFIDVEILNDSNCEINKQILVTTPTTSKGVEFDYVIIPNCDEKNYSDELDKNLLYISTTRALHKISFIYDGKLSNLLK